MIHRSAIWLAGVMAVVFICAGIAQGEKMWPSVLDEQKAQAQEFVEIKCDPCDYNIDFGSEYYPAEKVSLDEGTVKIKCDPCDYNVDYGGEYLPTDK